MNFQDIENGGKLPTFGLNSSLQNPSQAVAAGIFQINTAVYIFRRLVDAIGTSQDTPEPRQKMHKTRLRIGQLVKETPSKKAEDAKVARDFQAVLQDFQKVQRLAAERESAYLSSSPPTSFPSSSGSEENVAHDMDGESQPFLREQKRQEVLLLGNEVAFNAAIIEEREQGIKDIQIEIGQANDLTVLVHQQRVMIADEIGSNIEASSSVAAQAKVRISKASKKCEF